jgi:hypothetical protein
MGQRDLPRELAKVCIKPQETVPAGTHDLAAIKNIAIGYHLIQTFQVGCIRDDPMKLDRLASFVHTKSFLYSQKKPPAPE